MVYGSIHRIYIDTQGAITIPPFPDAFWSRPFH